ncbi:DNA-3-methyladenine glycosylase family protein [Aeromicrobium sp. UC242_57]|uniref:DNA-3-methyladenine glycosylase family protein n=1 Tax=Aeromicrobium sp. UC242_57 TaxID=3374624 RepID=UPI00379EC095
MSVAGARTILGRFAQAFGDPVSFDLAAAHGLTHAFATAEALAAADDTSLSMPRARARALIGVARAMAEGTLRLDSGTDREEARAMLVAMPGIGPWTADYICMRALAHPDVMLETDLIIRRMLQRHGIDAARTETWKPWRSYAAMYLWRASADDERTQ